MMSELLGFVPPLTPSGRTALVPPPPWHYSGDLLTVEYRTDPDGVRALLPPDLELAEEEPGAVAFLWADWQSCSDGGEELLDPSRSQYKEFFVVANALLDGEEVTTCPFIWVDRDFALARGWLQGFPKKLGEVWITRDFGLGGPADPGIRPGATFGGTCSPYGRRRAEGTVTLDALSEDGPQHNAAPIVNVRHFPR